MVDKLREFDLEISDIVAATTDGAAVMVKFVRLISKTSLHQQCLNHGIHLAVVYVLFKRNPSAYNPILSIADSEDEAVDSVANSASDCGDRDADDMPIF